MGHRIYVGSFWELGKFHKSEQGLTLSTAGLVCAKSLMIVLTTRLVTVSH